MNSTKVAQEQEQEQQFSNLKDRARFSLTVKNGSNSKIQNKWIIIYKKGFFVRKLYQS